MRSTHFLRYISSVSVPGLMIIVCTSMLGCGRMRGGAAEDVAIYYPDGKTYCEGTRRVRRSGIFWLGRDLDRLGIWRFYFPGGTLMSEYEYDEHGHEKRNAVYSPEGEVIEAWVENGNVSILTVYGSSGRMRYQSREEIVEEEDPHWSDSEADAETIESTFTWFNERGSPVWTEENTYVDDVPVGPRRILDSNGRPVLTINYRHGDLRGPNQD